jgi:uncharacterized protein involved in type VI secretion and phage assembly
MAGYFQKERLLRIDTILNTDPDEQKLNGDPLLLARLDGVEGISRLSAYDLVILRDAGGTAGQARPILDTTRLIGTHVEIGARPSNTPPGNMKEQGQDIFYKRVGVFEAFEDLLGIDITHLVLTHHRDFHIYRARVVPWVKVLTRDIRYRVFENKTVVDIIDAIAEEAKKTFLHLLIDTSALKNAQPPYTPMDYCVQFGESTFDFLSRLMARFGIWYYFGHTKSGGNFDVLNETMILKGNWDQSITTANIDDAQIAGGGAGMREIGNLVRRFRPPERRVAVGGFNYLDPSNPFYQDGTVSDQDDLLKHEEAVTVNGADTNVVKAADTKFLGATSFAQPVFSKADVTALDKVATSENQTEVFLISGTNRNQTFAPGHSFNIEHGKDWKPSDNLQEPYVAVVGKTFVIDQLAISANDYNYVVISTGLKIGDIILDALLGTINSLSVDATDSTNNAFYRVSLWATVTAQAMIYSAVNPLGGKYADTAAGTDMDIAGAINTVGGAASEIPVVGSAISSVLGALNLKKGVMDANNIAALAVAVIAVPKDPPLDLPLPLASRPVARGPHTALVIGPDDGKGVELQGHDIYSDALGRVRIRFPWDPGPPQSGSKIPPVFPFTASDKPTKVGGNTCWVRVSEGWAGRHYGIQFLPRIGQEVLVDFLDGDPERPVIIGRLYNADRRTTNLPFPAVSQEKTELLDLSKVSSTATTDPPLSGIKTYSIPTTDSGGSPLPERFHLLRFDDTRGKEQYLVRSQRRLDITALQKRYESISSDRHLTVGGKKITPPPKEIGGDYIAKVYRHYHLHVGDPDPELWPKSGNRNTLLEQNENFQSKGNADYMVGGNWSVTVGAPGSAAIGAPPGGQATIDAPGPMGTIVLNAMLNITLSVGGNSIVMTPAGISITSPSLITINAPVITSALPILPTGPAPLPPMPPIDAGPVTPTEPTAADPGTSLTPPQE